MAQVLHFTLPPEKLHAAFAGRLARQNPAPGDKRAYRLNVVNALWGQQGYVFLPEFLGLTQKHYGAGLRLVDFTQQKGSGTGDQATSAGNCRFPPAWLADRPVPRTKVP
jgi:serine protease inhibitor